MKLKITLLLLSAALTVLLCACKGNGTKTSSDAGSLASQLTVSDLFPSEGTDSEYQITSSEVDEFIKKQESSNAAASQISSGVASSDDKSESSSKASTSDASKASSVASSAAASSEKAEWTKGWY